MNNKKKSIFLSIIAFALLAVLIFLAETKKASKKWELQEQPSPREETTEELLQRLTPKEITPPDEEERKRTEELLKNITPQKPAPITPEKEKETENLLRDLTPR